MKKRVMVTQGDFDRFDVTVLRPGDAGFDSAARGCRPPDMHRDEPPKPIFFDMGRK